MRLFQKMNWRNNPSNNNKMRNNKMSKQIEKIRPNRLKKQKNAKKQWMIIYQS